MGGNIVQLHLAFPPVGVVVVVSARSVQDGRIHKNRYYNIKQPTWLCIRHFRKKSLASSLTVGLAGNSTDFARNMVPWLRMALCV